MSLAEYLNAMISQEACALSKLCKENDSHDRNHALISAVFRRLDGFVKDYDRYVTGSPAKADRKPHN